jgi:hypothetical protein
MESASLTAQCGSLCVAITDGMEQFGQHRLKIAGIPFGRVSVISANSVELFDR